MGLPKCHMKCIDKDENKKKCDLKACTKCNAKCGYNAAKHLMFVQLSNCHKKCFATKCHGCGKLKCHAECAKKKEEKKEEKKPKKKKDKKEEKEEKKEKAAKKEEKKEEKKEKKEEKKEKKEKEEEKKPKKKEEKVKLPKCHMKCIGKDENKKKCDLKACTKCNAKCGYNAAKHLMFVQLNDCHKKCFATKCHGCGKLKCHAKCAKKKEEKKE